ncbi:MAG: acetylxylan esterase [Bacteroidales bacterium]|nr:acetylxylan esterase [Bacteroidales bacterium]
MNIKYLALCLLAITACSANNGSNGGECLSDKGWLFMGKGPYTLNTKVEAAPGEASFCLVTDLSLMAEEPEVVLRANVTVAADSTICVPLGKLEPGFYQVRLRDSVRWNIGVRPLDVVSPPDARPDFDAFWKQTFEELDAVPFEPEYTVVPEFSNDVRTTYDVRYTSLGGATAGCSVCIPNAPGKYPVLVQYMGYGAPTFRFGPSDNPERIDVLVSVRRQGIFKEADESWVTQGVESKETYYYRGAFCDVRRAIDLVASMDKADMDKVVAMGESQGGAFTTVAAAIDDRIDAISIAVPFLGDYQDYAKIVWWPVHEVLDYTDANGIDRSDLYETLSYFDVKNFAPRVSCPVIMAFGLQDPTCPPHTNFAIYNNLGTADKRFVCVPTCGHAMWLEPDWPPVRDTFLSPWLK